LWEAQGIALLEAVAAKKPIIASNIKAFKSILRDRENALLIDPNDPLDLKNKLELPIYDRNLQKTIYKYV